MSASVVVTPSTPSTPARAIRPSFTGIVRGELLKISRQLATWLVAAFVAACIALPYLAQLAEPGFKSRALVSPDAVWYRIGGADAMVLRVFGGLLLIVVTARLIGMEYSGGTIRVLLARGVGRVQLLVAKLAAVSIVAVLLFAGGVVLNVVLTVLLFAAKMGDLSLLGKAPAYFFNDVAILGGEVFVSYAVTILMAAAVTVVGRSLAFGMTVAIAWYPVENFAVLFAGLGASLLNNDFLLLLTGDMLATNLNVMAFATLPERAAAMGFPGFSTPLVPVTGGHTLLVVAVWAVVFLAVALVLTWQRDVKE